jgi:hypothetical protein
MAVYSCSSMMTPAQYRGARANIRGGITIERDLPANTRLWLTGWTETIPGGEVVSLLVEIADKNGRSRQCR